MQLRMFYNLNNCMIVLASCFCEGKLYDIACTYVPSKTQGCLVVQNLGAYGILGDYHLFTRMGGFL